MRVLLVSPTGSGKTVMFCYMAYRAILKGKRIQIWVHRRELVKQVCETLAQFGVDFGVIAQGHAIDNTKLVQVCSIQTLVNRTDRVMEPDLIIIDECHHATAGSWLRCLESYPRSFVLGVTATPERLDGKPLSIAFDEIVLGPTVMDLIALGNLCQPVYFRIPSTLDGMDLPRSGGDYRKADLLAATEAATDMDGNTIFGSAVKNMIKICPDDQGIGYCRSIDHAERVAAKYRAHGINAVTLTGETPNRDEVVRDFKRGRLQYLSTVDLVSEGFDIPAIVFVQMLRKTASLGLCLQQGGRGLRPAPGKTRAIILDHVGNTIGGHGRLEEDRHWTLEGAQVRKKPLEAAQDRQCPDCYCCHPPASECPECGHIYGTGKQRREIVEVDGELVEVTGDEITKGFMECRNCGQLHREGIACPACGFDLAREVKRDRRHEERKCSTMGEWMELAKQRGYKPGWARMRFTKQKNR